MRTVSLCDKIKTDRKYIATSTFQSWCYLDQR